MQPQLLEDINRFNPNWSDNLVEYIDGNNVADPILISNNGIDFDADIISYDTCVVGEIHGFTGSYANQYTEFYCAECDKLGNYLSEAFSADNPRIFEDRLTELYAHMKSKKHMFEDDES